MKNLIKDCVRDIVNLLVDKNYEKLNELYIERDSELQLEDLITCLHGYWEFWDHAGEVTTPPLEAYESIDIIEYSRPMKAFREFRIEFLLWIDGKESDLSLICDIMYFENNSVKANIYDFHVM